MSKKIKSSNFWCPSGIALSTGKSETEKLKDEITRLNALLKTKQAEIEAEKNIAEHYRKNWNDQILATLTIRAKLDEITKE